MRAKRFTGTLEQRLDELKDGEVRKEFVEYIADAASQDMKLPEVTAAILDILLLRYLNKNLSKRVVYLSLEKSILCESSVKPQFLVNYHDYIIEIGDKKFLMTEKVDPSLQKFKINGNGSYVPEPRVQEFLVTINDAVNLNIKALNNEKIKDVNFRIRDLYDRYGLNYDVQLFDTKDMVLDGKYCVAALINPDENGRIIFANREVDIKQKYRKAPVFLIADNKNIFWHDLFFDIDSQEKYAHYIRDNDKMTENYLKAFEILSKMHKREPKKKRIIIMDAIKRQVINPVIDKRNYETYLIYRVNAFGKNFTFATLPASKNEKKAMEIELAIKNGCIAYISEVSGDKKKILKQYFLGNLNPEDMFVYSDRIKGHYESLSGLALIKTGAHSDVNINNKRFFLPSYLKGKHVFILFSNDEYDFYDMSGNSIVLPDKDNNIKSRNLFDDSLFPEHINYKIMQLLEELVSGMERNSIYLEQYERDVLAIILQRHYSGTLQKNLIITEGIIKHEIKPKKVVERNKEFLRYEFNFLNKKYYLFEIQASQAEYKSINLEAKIERASQIICNIPIGKKVIINYGPLRTKKGKINAGAKLIDMRRVPQNLFCSKGFYITSSDSKGKFWFNKKRYFTGENYSETNILIYFKDSDAYAFSFNGRLIKKLKD